MRIRSIKPEFWRSEDVAALDWYARLVFIGLWSYVDDNGVGRDDERIICADLFALDESFSESSLRAHAALNTLSNRGMITRYSVDGRRFLHITTWERHQKINRPSPPRLPLPTSGNAGIHDTLTEDSLSAHNSDGAGAVEQGSRGTGEQRKKNSSPGSERTSPARERGSKGERPRGSRAVAEHLNGTAHSPAANQIAEAYATSCTQRPPGELLSTIAVKADGCLQSDYTPQQIAAGIKAWSDSDMHHPSAIPSFVHRIVNRPDAGKIRQSRSDTDFAQAESLKRFDTDQGAIE